MLCGLAGSVVVCRGGGEAVTALPGVAIAVALMPPLCTVGFGLGGGFDLAIMGGASLLFLTNLVAIVASAFLVFLLVGLNTEEVRKAMAAPRKNESLSRLLSHGPVTRMLTAGGQLRWRIVMIVVLLASVAVPLRRALLQVARETGARGAVQDELKRLVPADALVSQQVSVGQDEIVIRLISTKRIPDAKVAEARADLMRRTGHDVQLSVEAVASTRELADLVARLAQPAQVVVARETSVDELQKELLDRVGPAARDLNVDMIVMSTHGHGVFYRFLLGSVTAKVLHESHCPVWTGAHLGEAPPDEFSIRHVLCSVDLSGRSCHTASLAAELAAAADATLTLVHITASVEIYGPGGPRVDPAWKEMIVGFAAKEIAKLQQEVGTKAEVIIDSGNVPELLNRAAERTNADLMVVGHSPGRSHLGDNGEGYGVIRESHIPVLSV